MKPVVRWIGGKGWLAPEIAKRIPIDCTYCEPFGGGLAVLLNRKPVKGCPEIVNDINGDLINFYRVAKYHVEALVQEIECLLWSREIFDEFGANPGITDIQRAARWYYRNKICFGGKERAQTYGYSRKKPAFSFLSVASFLEAFSERLCRVQIEHLDWRDFVGRYDSPSTFFYVDPPYDCSQAYQQAFSQSDHQALRDFLMACEGRWLLSYNDTDFIRDLYCGCHFEVFERKVPFNAQGSI